MLAETKISLPAYKLLYAFCSVLILSLVRGISYSDEIGIAMEAPMALLAIVFCADTYTQEIISKRSEIQRLYPLNRRLSSIAIRMAIQEIALLTLCAVGYGMFFLFQKPQSLCQTGQSTESELRMFLVFLAAMAVTLWFWGMLSNLMSCLFRNMWAGIGCCVVLWLETDSSFGETYLGNWNLFSYTFRNTAENQDFRWLYGKALCMLICVFLAFLTPKIMKKRG